MKGVLCGLAALVLLCTEASGQPITAPRTIATKDVNMSVQTNQVGYYPAAPKHCVVRGERPAPFEVVDAQSGRTAYRGEMTPAGSDFGAFVSGDFSSLQTPGVYYIRSQGGRSYPFRIGEEVYDEPIGLILDYFARQRCGNSTTGYLTPCHLDDGVRVDNGRHQDVTGGWHDASDLRKWVQCTIYGMVGILRMAQRLAPAGENPRITEELKWGNRYFLNMQEPEGYVMEHVGGDLFTHADNNRWTDNVIGNDDDRLIQTLPIEADLRKAPETQSFVAQFTFAAVEAMMAGYMSAEPEYADRCLKAAQRCFDWSVQNIKTYQAGSYGSGIIAAIELYKATGEQRYRAEATRMANALLQLQVDPREEGALGGFFRSSAGSSTYYNEVWRLDFVLTSLCMMAETFPIHADLPRYREAIARYCDSYLAPLASRNGFAMVPLELLDKPVNDLRRAGRYGYRYFMDPAQPWWVGMNANVAGKGIGLLMASRILGEPCLAALAQRQLDWILGANPLGMPTMRGVGFQHPAHLPEFVNDGEFVSPTPILPGAVMNGIGGDAQDMPIFMPGSWQTGEYWTPMVGMTLWLMADLKAAY